MALLFLYLFLSLLLLLLLHYCLFCCCFCYFFFASSNNISHVFEHICYIFHKFSAFARWYEWRGGVAKRAWTFYLPPLCWAFSKSTQLLLKCHNVCFRQSNLIYAGATCWLWTLFATHNSIHTLTLIYEYVCMCVYVCSPVAVTKVFRQLLLVINISYISLLLFDWRWIWNALGWLLFVVCF